LGSSVSVNQAVVEIAHTFRHTGDTVNDDGADFFDSADDIGSAECIGSDFDIEWTGRVQRMAVSVIDDAEIVGINPESFEFGAYLGDIHGLQRLGPRQNGGSSSVTKQKRLAAVNGAVVVVIRGEKDIISFTSQTQREADSHKGRSLAVGHIESTRVAIVIIIADRVEENVITSLNDFQRPVLFDEIVRPARRGGREFLDDVPPS